MSKDFLVCSVLGLGCLVPFFSPRAVAQSPYAGAVKFHVHTTQQPGTVKLYRLLFADGTHCYTTSEAEVRTMTTSRKYQAKIEPMDMFVYTEQTPGTTRLYRFTQKRLDGGWRSFYTAFEPEKNHVAKGKYSDLHSMKAYVFPHTYRPKEFVLQEGRPTTPDVQDVTLSKDPQHPSRGAEAIISNNYDGITLVRFDLSRVPTEARIRSATLELFCTSVGFAQEEIQRTSDLKVYRFCHEWQEGTGTDQLVRHDGADFATFDGRSPWPKGGPKACAGELLATFAHKGNYRNWCKWNLEGQIIQDWMSPGTPNYGLMIQGTPGAKALCYVSSDGSERHNRPILRLALSYSDDIVPVYWCHNPVNGDHFYTISEEERDSFIEEAKQDVALKRKQEEERRKQQELARKQAAVKKEQERQKQMERARLAEASKRKQEKQRRTHASARYTKIRGRAPSAVGIVGTPIRVGDIEWRVVSAKNLGKTLRSGNRFIGNVDARGRFVAVELRVENKGKAPKTLIAPDLFDEKGRRFTNSLEAEMYAPRDKRLSLLETLNPNVPFVCWLIYDVATDATGLTLLVGDLAILGDAEGAIDVGL